MASGTRVLGTFDYPTRVALGDVQGVTAFRKFGMNDVVGAGTYDIWPSASTRQLPAAAGTVAVVSSSVNDTAAGTGARTVVLSGLDANYLTISETIALNGTTPVNSVNSYLRVNRTYVSTAGSGSKNAGLITFSIGGNPQSFIEVSQGQCHCTQYTVPANKYILITSTRFGTGRMSGSADLHILGFIREYQADPVWRAIQDVYLFQNIYEPPTGPGQLVGPRTELRYVVTSTAATQVWAEWTGWEIDA